MEDDRLICFCYAVKRSEIIAAIQAGCDSLTKVQNETLASTGCGGCAGDIQELIDELLKESREQPK